MSKPKFKDLDVEVPEELIRELLTDSEGVMIKQRYQIINLLNEGLSIRAIAKKIGVGTDTVVRISRKLESSAKIQEFLKKPGDEKSASKWVFGQVSSEEK